MNDQCPACRKDWEQGDFTVVIGMIKQDGSATLVHVHRDCIMINVLGEERAAHIIARERRDANLKGKRNGS